jgi:ribosomal-protein-alanine N-acetyltransferase
MTRMLLPTPTLHTARLRLRPFDDADANDLFALHSDAYVLRYWDAPPWSERVRSERFITACRQKAERGTGPRLAVDRACDGALIGWCSLNRSWTSGPAALRDQLAAIEANLGSSTGLPA